MDFDKIGIQVLFVAMTSKFNVWYEISSMLLLSMYCRGKPRSVSTVRILPEVQQAVAISIHAGCSGTCQAWTSTGKQSPTIILL